MDFATKAVIESQAAPGVRFTVRRLNVLQRQRRDAPLAEARARMTQHSRKLDLLRPVDSAAGFTDEEKAADLISAIQAEEVAHFLPAYVRAGLVKIEGLELDGAAATDVETVLEHAPDELLWEIYRECCKASGMSVEQSKNSPLPGTSDEPEAGQTPSTTASGASVRADT